MAARRSKATPDDILATNLDACARRLAFDDATPSDAASELRALAGGRVDLLARVAGKLAGVWSVRSEYDGGTALLAAGFLVRAGGTAEMDFDLRKWVEEGRFAAERVERDARGLAAFHSELRQQRSQRG